MALPFVLSPYLRPIKAADREGFVLDDGVSGWIELDASCNPSMLKDDLGARLVDAGV